MTMRLSKTQDEAKLLVERVMYTKRYSLLLDKKRCVGCDLCQIVCPKEAIKVMKPAKIGAEKLNKPTVSIDENKCHFCGICKAICPFGAVTLMANGVQVVPVLEKESFPQLLHEVQVDESKCPVDCNKCEEACPFDLVRVIPGKDHVRVEVDREHCPGCRLCEAECPYDAIRVRRIISGTIEIDKEKCPENCHDCVDVCPVPGVLRFSDDRKVNVNAFACIYCGVCRIVCPIEGALVVQRDSVYHAPVRSGAWNKALEKLTSAGDMAKELRGKSVTKAWESVRRRFS